MQQRRDHAVCAVEAQILLLPMSTGMLAGVLYDPAEGVSCDALYRKLPEAGHRHCGIRHFLPEPHEPAEHAWCAPTLYVTHIEHKGNSGLCLVLAISAVSFC